MKKGNVNNPDTEDNLTSRSHWEKRQGSGILKVRSFNIPMLNFLKKIIPHGKQNKLEFLEVGCIPGRYLLYFSKILGYKVEGVDYVEEIKQVEETLKFYGVSDFHVHKKDFFKFESQKKYDVVASFGFIEHFQNSQKVVDLHTRLVKKGGYIVLMVPNLNYLQRKFLARSNPTMFETHNMDILKPEALNKMLGYEFEIKYSGYVETLRLYGRVKTNGTLWKVIAYILKRSTNVLERMLVFVGLSFPNKYISPHIAIVAKKLT